MILDSSVLSFTVLSIAGLLCSMIFFGFVILQSATPDKLQSILKPKKWKRQLTQRSEFSVLGYFLIATQFLGGVWVFASLAYTSFAWTGFISRVDMILYGFVGYFMFWLVWSHADRIFVQEPRTSKTPMETMHAPESGSILDGVKNDIEKSLGKSDNMRIDTNGDSMTFTFKEQPSAPQTKLGKAMDQLSRDLEAKGMTVTRTDGRKDQMLKATFVSGRPKPNQSKDD